jgi:hypothetical protein
MTIQSTPQLKRFSPRHHFLAFLQIAAIVIGSSPLAAIFTAL